MTPRYDYNQLMYRLALDDPRLALPVAVYRVRNADRSVRFLLRDQVEARADWEHVEKVGWFAMPPLQQSDGLIAVHEGRSDETVLSTERPETDARVLFRALPLPVNEPETRVDGLWNCRALTTEGGEPLDFSLKLSQLGNVVRVGNPGEAIVGLGAFDGKQLTLSLTNEQKTFTLQAQATGRTLSGQWQENGTSTKGTWSAKLPDSTPPERRSPALVVLREFRKSDESGYDYSIDADPPPRCLPNGRPICRVWKVPGSALTLDWKAKPATGR